MSSPRRGSLELNEAVTSSHQALLENSRERLASYSPAELAPWVLVPGEVAPECHGDSGHMRDGGPHLHAPRTQCTTGGRRFGSRNPWAFRQGLLIVLRTDTAEVWCF